LIIIIIIYRNGNWEIWRYSNNIRFSFILLLFSHPGIRQRNVSIMTTSRQHQNPATSSPSSLSSPSSSATTARDRLSSLSSHIMGSNGNPSVFTPAAVAAAPEDPLFGLMKAYREDPSDKKVDLGIGAYRDNNAKPWILPVVKKVCLS
jgi:hypothetical protein